MGSLYIHTHLILESAIFLYVIFAHLSMLGNKDYFKNKEKEKKQPLGEEKLFKKDSFLVVFLFSILNVVVTQFLNELIKEGSPQCD